MLGALAHVRMNELIPSRCFLAFKLAALDCPSWSARDITKVLLAAGADINIACKQGKTARQLAEENDECTYALEAFTAFEQRFENEAIGQDIEALKSTLTTKYTFPRDYDRYDTRNCMDGQLPLRTSRISHPHLEK
jgi:hypothetical protein